MVRELEAVLATTTWLLHGLNLRLEWRQFQHQPTRALRFAAPICDELSTSLNVHNQICAPSSARVRVPYGVALRFRCDRLLCADAKCALGQCTLNLCNRLSQLIHTLLHLSTEHNPRFWKTCIYAYLRSNLASFTL